MKLKTVKTLKAVKLMAAIDGVIVVGIGAWLLQTEYRMAGWCLMLVGGSGFCTIFSIISMIFKEEGES